jgi:hypothetical protein
LVGYKNEKGLGDLLRRQLNQNRTLERGNFLIPARRHSRCPRLDPDRLTDACSLTSARCSERVTRMPCQCQEVSFPRSLKTRACSQRVRYECGTPKCSALGGPSLDGPAAARQLQFGSYCCTCTLQARWCTGWGSRVGSGLPNQTGHTVDFW